MAQDQKSQFDQDILNKKLFRLEYLFFLPTFPVLQVNHWKALISAVMKIKIKSGKSSQEKMWGHAKKLTAGICSQILRLAVLIIEGANIFLIYK